MFSGGPLFGATQGASQTFTMGFGASQVTGSGEAPMKKSGKQEEKQTVLPMTISGIEHAVAQRSDGGELHFFGMEPGMLILVGAVEVAVKQTASLELVVNDATGRIKVRHFFTDCQPGEFDDIVAGRYVSVFGNVRTAPELHLAAMGVRLAQSADEVSYHMIEAAHAALRLQKGTALSSLTSPTKPSGFSMDYSPPKETGFVATATPAVGAATPAPAAAPQQASKVRLEGAALRTAILAYIKREEVGRDEGVSVKAICGYTEPAPTSEVRSLLEELVGEGEVITTIDDDHFSCQI